MTPAEFGEVLVDLLEADLERRKKLLANEGSEKPSGVYRISGPTNGGHKVTIQITVEEVIAPPKIELPPKTPEDLAADAESLRLFEEYLEANRNVSYLPLPNNDDDDDDE